ncbi:uncharacterized protein EDB93DRAFT_1257639 [Suillus bovinus]|uniref:uncharacterized protein n=1 Tax=Suillus bovinus TaxID=48563 RepID=UPI001B8864F6|nr:uncharacterized protein EDB93DRAFT_1257639 [Suillus bovinus]KAG2126264.1 hypothetical protein EDB93DRAFT_1257639 [Suillus bovinus]
MAMKSLERAPAVRDVDGVDEESSDDSEGEMDRVGASLEAYSDRALLAVVRHGFAHYMGIPNLQVKHLPVSWPKDDEAWLTDSVTSTKLVRFLWEESHTHSDNHEGLCKIWTYIHEKGALFSPSAEKALKVISEEHLRERVIEKYHSLQKALWPAGHIPSMRVSAVASATASAQRLGEPGDPPPLTKGVRQSRQLGKLEVRERKFKALPDDSKYKTDAYKTALIQQLMSEDENERDAEGKLTGCFLMRPWMWASDKRNMFIADVDAQQDPELPKRYTKRVCGPIGKAGLPWIQKVEHRARRWMVSPQWLVDPANQQFDVPAFVIDNEKKCVKIEKREYAAKKKIKLDEKVSKKVKAKGKGKGKAKAVEEAQPVTSSSKAVAEKDGNESSDFE